MRKENRLRLYFIIGILVIVGFAAFLWFYQSNQMKSNMTEKEFGDLQDKEMEIVDTSVFLDEELESWYYDKRQEAGEYTYVSGDSTYILVSIGKVEEENTFLLLNGVKDIDGKLAVGYDKLIMNDVPNVEFEDSIRSTLVKVEGNYEKVKVIDVEENLPQS